MSSMPSALSPLTDRIQRLRQLGSDALDSIGGTIGKGVTGVETMLGFPPVQGSPHQQAIDQMNRDAMMHKNDAANQSFRLSTMKKPLGK